MPQELVAILMEQPWQEDDYEQHPKFENLGDFMFQADICLRWTFSVTQSKRYSGLATFYFSRTQALVPVAEDQLGYSSHKLEQ